jgi:RNA-binding protein YlmH
MSRLLPLDDDPTSWTARRCLSPSARLAGERLDRVLAELSGLSRARVQALMAEGA